MIDLPGLKYLVTGTGHCGTEWGAEVLRKAGLRAVHEGIFQNSIQEPGDWTGAFEAEVSCKAAPHIGDIIRDRPDIRIVHLVRNPLHVIRSMYYCPTEHGWAWASKEWVQGELGRELPTKSVLGYLTAFYVEWTDQIDRHNIDTVKVESGANSLLMALGIEPKERLTVERIGARAKEGAPELSWDDIPRNSYRDRLCQKYMTYGYGW